MTNVKYKRQLDDLLLLCKKNLPKVDEQLIRRAYDFIDTAGLRKLPCSGRSSGSMTSSLIDDNYKRYLENSIRKHFPFSGVPIVLSLKAKQRHGD